MSRDDELELRAPALEDVDALFAAVDADRARLRVWLPWVDLTKSPDDTRAFIERSITGASAGTTVDRLLIHEGHIAGIASLSEISEPHQRGMIGYWIGSAWEGRGFVSRAVRELLRLGFVELGLERIALLAATENSRSRAVAERCGFTFEGVLRRHEKLNDRFVDHAVYSMLADEWRDEER